MAEMLRYGAFARFVSLPQGARTEELLATYADGVLESRVPVDDADTQPRKIPVQRAGA